MWARWLLIAIPVIEIALFITVGSAIGVWSTIGLVLLAAVVGLSILRSNGARSLPAVQAALQQGQDPGQEIFRATLRMMGGGLLLIPGFASDIIGLILLLPPVQSFVYAKAKSRLKAGGPGAFGAQGFSASFGQGGFSASGFSGFDAQGFGGQGFGAQGFGAQGFGTRQDDDVIDADFEDVTRRPDEKRLTDKRDHEM